jgi:hypothetical protein
MNRAEKIRALPRRHITVSLDLTPEEYEDLVTAVLAKRQARQDRLPLNSPWRGQVIERTSPLAHFAVEFDVQIELVTTILKYIGHEGRPTLAAQYQRLNAEEAEVPHISAEELVRAA